MMNEAELKELEELTGKCIDKRNNKPKQSARTEDLQRLANLRRAVENERRDQEAEEARATEVLLPLTEDEKKEMAELERCARQEWIHKNQAPKQPEPHDMIRLGKLRRRAKATQ